MTQEGKVKPRKSVCKYITIQVLPKGVAVVLSLCCIASASVCIGYLTVGEPNLKNSTARSQGHSAEIQHHYSDNSHLRLSTQLTAGWIILASLAVLLYQVLTAIQISGIFCISVVCLKIPEVIVNAVGVIAYAPAAIVLAVYTYQWTVSIVSTVQSDYHDQQLNGLEHENWVSQYIFKFILPVGFTCVFSLISTLNFLAMMIISIMTKTVCKRPTSKQAVQGDD